MVYFADRKERWKNILKLAWPLILANSFWNLQITIDRIFLGQYSTEALGAAMAVMGTFWTPMALLQQTTAYLTTFVAQYYGAKRFPMIGKALWQSIWVAVVGGILLLGMVPFAPSLFELFDHAESLRALETEYFVALTYSTLPTALVAVASSFFTGLGQTRVIIGINCVGFLFNAILDYLLIFGNFGFPKLGIYGAGLATTIATWAAAVYGLALVFRKKNELEFNVFSGFGFDVDLLKRFLRFGFPSGLQWALEGLAFTAFLIIIGRMQDGKAALAGSSIVVTVMMVSILPALGIAQAVSVLVGQHMGEKNPQEAEVAVWSGLQVAIIYMVTIGVTFLLFPGFYLSWFKNADNPKLWMEVSIIVPYLLMYVACFTIFDSMNLTFSFALKGAGDTQFVTLVALTMPWPLMVIPSWYLKDWPGGVYWAWGAASVFIACMAMVFLWRFRQGKWKSMSVIN